MHKADEASQRTEFGLNRLDRQALIRPDEGKLRELEGDGARYILYAEDRTLVSINGRSMIASFEHRTARYWMDGDAQVFLGLDGETPVFAASAPTDLPLPDDVKAIDLRSLALQGVLPPGELGMIAQGRSMLHWHATHRFCSACGHPSQMSQGGYRRDCPNCGTQHFPRTDPVAIMLITRGDHCLLGRSGRFDAPMYSTLAGFIEPGETIEDAVRRETLEESGIAVGRVSYHSSQPWPFPASLMIGCVGEATSEEITLDKDELEDARWFSRDDVAAMAANRHSEGLLVPPPISIAALLIQSWLDGEAG